MDNRMMVNAGAPPPPSEVKVRTMHSDLAAMAQSGGGMPRFENVSVSGLSIEKESPPPARPARPAAPEIPASAPVVSPTHFAPAAQPMAVASTPSAQPAATIQTSNTGPIQVSSAPKKDMYPVFIVAVVALLAILGVGYVAYITFFNGAASQNATTSSSTTAQNVILPPVASTTTGTGGNGTTASTISPELSSAHVSLFKKSADQTIAVDLGPVTSNTYRKAMATALSGVSAAASMIEIHATANDNNTLSIQGLLSTAGAQILSAQALTDFNPDATFFVYRDKNGTWPGYVLSLNAGVATSSAAGAVVALESSPNIANIFLTDPGKQSADGFTGSTIAGVSARVLPFISFSIPSYFTYGWYGNDLILSASQNGFSAAMAYLQ